MRTSTITQQESDNTQELGLATLAEMAIQSGMRTLYSSPRSNCIDTVQEKQRMLCLYLYLYAAATWCPHSTHGWLTVEQYEAIIMNIQTLQKQCCSNIALNGYAVSTPQAPTYIGTFILEFVATPEQDGISEITNINFKDVRVTVVRGNLLIPMIPIADGQYTFTKPASSTTVTLSSPMVEDEYIKITTIPI